MGRLRRGPGRWDIRWSARDPSERSVIAAIAKRVLCGGHVENGTKLSCRTRLGRLLGLCQLCRLPFSLRNQPKRTPCCAFLAHRVRPCCMQQSPQYGPGYERLSDFIWIFTLHTGPDRSCAKCGDHGIELIPLQRNMDPPMSDWFRSLPHAIDSIANAVKVGTDTSRFPRKN